MTGTVWTDDPRFAKGCTCCDHSVPHWLWMDRMDRQRVRDLIALARRAQMVFEDEPTWLNRQAVLTAVAGVAAVDRPRIAEKVANMRRLGIAELPPDLLAQIEDEWARPRTPAFPPPAEPEPMPEAEAEELRARVRQTAMSLEMAANPKEADRLRAELNDLDRRLRDGRRT